MRTTVSVSRGSPVRVAVTVTEVAPSPSPMLDGLTLNSMPSLSLSLTVRTTGPTDSPPVAVALRMMVSSPSTSLSSVTVKPNAWRVDALVAPSGMVMRHPDQTRRLSLPHPPCRCGSP